MKYHFYLKKKKLSDKLKLLGLGIWQTFFFVLFFKMNEVSLTFQGKQLAVFVASDKPWFLKWKLEFWNTRMYHQQLNSFAVLTLLMGTVGIFTNVLFWYCTTKYVKPLEYPPNTVNQYLSNDKHQCSKVLDEWKAHWEGEVDLCVQPEPATGDSWPAELWGLFSRICQPQPWHIFGEAGSRLWPDKHTWIRCHFVVKAVTFLLERSF